MSDTVISISADGSIKQWSAKAQPHPPNSNFPPPHVLGLVSLSVAPNGQRAIYNSIEGMTALWDLGSGEVVGKYESYVRGSEDAEPCMYSVSLHEVLLKFASSLVGISAPKLRNVRVMRRVWERIHPFCPTQQFRGTPIYPLIR